MRGLIVAFLGVVAAFVVYLFIIRPRQIRWGATDEEVSRPMMGDDIVRKPNFVATRAVNTAAPPSEVWKWIIQIGSARAGWYSLDWIDNAGVPSSRELLPEFQKIEEGYFIPFTPDQKNGMWVKEFKAHEYILWWDKKGNGTWGWYLERTDDGNTRLITRLRTTYDLSFPWVIYYMVYDFGDIIMMRKCLLGIKARAETQTARSE